MSPSSRPRVAVIRFPGSNCEGESLEAIEGRGSPAGSSAGTRIPPSSRPSTPTSCPAASATRTASAPERWPRGFRWPTSWPVAPRRVLPSSASATARRSSRRPGSSRATTVRWPWPSRPIAIPSAAGTTRAGSSSGPDPARSSASSRAVSSSRSPCPPRTAKDGSSRARRRGGQPSPPAAAFATARPTAASRAPSPGCPTAAPSGSRGLSNAAGNVLALMPHPDRALRLAQVPDWLPGPWGDRRRAARTQAELEADGPGMRLFRALAGALGVEAASLAKETR
jgi:hypothetical protein